MKWHRLHWAHYADGTPVGKPIYVWATSSDTAQTACARLVHRLTQAKLA
jgi:hypothetical protein